LDDATWGVFQEGWRVPWGADADHLKTEEDIAAGAAAGYVQFTLDPRDDVDNAPETDSLAVLEQKFAALRWAALETTAADTRRAYLGHCWVLGEGFCLTLTREQLLRAACKYGPAVARLTRLYRYLQRAMGPRPFDVEISVDETDTPTRPAEHLYIAGELKRLGVAWVSLAPRYVGRFEKGVDYIGDLAPFEADFAWHVALARALGPYKLSLHSGSDKFSIYPSAARIAGELVHLKTAGTSYLAALRALARIDPPLFRAILHFAVDYYERDRASYYVSAALSRIPAPDTLNDAALDGLLDLRDVRQVLHVTFGTVLTAADAQGRPLFRERLLAALEGDEEAHYAALEAHITRHLRPFSD
jgi:tagaturonate epimerase